MGADDEAAASAHSRRLAKWTRDADDLRAASAPPDDPETAPEVAAMARYRRSRTGVIRLPHPLVSARRYGALTRRRHELNRRSALAVALLPVLIVIGALLDPLAAQVAIWALLVPSAGAVIHYRRKIRAIDAERQITLRGGVADAWSDWLAARTRLEQLDDASQARAQLGASEDRMHALVLTLSTDENHAARDWVYRNAAGANALAATEQRLELETVRAPILDDPPS
ncbi:hypothetical protein ACLM5J_16785 [Nocardioides sp. Bht2]|uniref:hypothetical protein n=1 Tax=Nocardioides sp. Bht2 TaxID=3392297 RepID=UPI0039B587E4